MISEEQGDAATTDNALNLVAASFLMFQFIIFFLFYNFTTNIYILGLGWILLIPGLILVILSAKTDIKESERLYRFTKLPKYFGWSIISISLSFIPACSCLNISSGIFPDNQEGFMGYTCGLKTVEYICQINMAKDARMAS